MKRLILLSGLLWIFTGSANADEIKLRSDAWCPYSCDPASDKQGILVEVAKIIFQKAGHTVDYGELNWARAIAEVREGKSDGLVDAYKSDAPDFIFPEEPVLISKMCFFVKEDDSWKFKGYDTLKGRQISVINDYSYGEKFDAYIQKNANQGDRTITILSGMDLTRRRIKQIAAGRIDTVLEDWFVFPSKVKSRQQMKEYKQIKGFKNVGCLRGEKLYIAFTPNKASSHTYADLLTKGIREMKASGELEKIINKYK